MIQSIKIYIAPLQDPYLEALPTQAKRKRTVFSRWWNWEQPPFGSYLRLHVIWYEVLWTADYKLLQETNLAVWQPCKASICSTLILPIPPSIWKGWVDLSEGSGNLSHVHADLLLFEPKCRLSSKCRSIKYVMLLGREGSGKCDSLWEGRGAKIMCNVAYYFRNFVVTGTVSSFDGW